MDDGWITTGYIVDTGAIVKMFAAYLAAELDRKLNEELQYGKMGEENQDA